MEAAGSCNCTCNCNSVAPASLLTAHNRDDDDDVAIAAAPLATTFCLEGYVILCRINGNDSQNEGRTSTSAIVTIPLVACCCCS